MKKSILGAPLLALVLSACTVTGPERPAASAGGVFTSVSGGEVQTILQNAGYRAELGVDNVGDPMISSSAGGLGYTLYFYECSGEKRCDSLVFWAGFAMDDKPSLDTINQWNQTKRFSRAYLDEEGDPILEMDLLVDGGITEAAFVETLNLWDQSLPLFAQHVGFR